MNHSFVWTDLSTFNMRKAKNFYRHCLGWKFANMGDGYFSCQANGQPSAGLYVMPKKFQKIGMPSFWMSYIQVGNIAEIVQIATQHGGRVEVRPEEATGGGKVALIRDPSGAGFTCYEGKALNGRSTTYTAGRMVWNELHVSDITKVKSFYTNLFQWDIRSIDKPNRYEIYNAGQLIGAIQVTPNAIKGDKEYWGVYFAVNDFNKTLKRIEWAGGQLLVEERVGEQTAVLALDPQGAAFYIIY